MFDYCAKQFSMHAGVVTSSPSPEGRVQVDLGVQGLKNVRMTNLRVVIFIIFIKP